MHDSAIQFFLDGHASLAMTGSQRREAPSSRNFSCISGKNIRDPGAWTPDNRYCDFRGDELSLCCSHYGDFEATET